MIQLIDIPKLKPTLGIEEAAETFGVSYQSISQTVADKKVFSFTSGKGAKRMISTWDLIEKLNLFPKDAITEIIKQQFGKSA